MQIARGMGDKEQGSRLELLEGAGDDGALGGIVNDDRLSRLADGFEDGGEVAGVGGGQAGDGLEVI